MAESAKKIIIGILVQIFFYAIIIFWILDFLTNIPAGGLSGGASYFLRSLFILVIAIVLGFIYKLISKSKLLIKISIGLIVIFIIYFIIAGILFLTESCPTYFDSMPKFISTARKQPPIPLQETLQGLFCPFTGKVY